MTDNRVLVDQNGTESVFVNRSDGLAVSRLKKAGYTQVIVSTETNPVVGRRAEKLGIPVVHGVDDKGEILRRYLEENGIETFTLVTSNYHQMWAQVLFNAKTATYEKEPGYKVRILGNYNYQARPAIQRKRNAKTGLNQLTSLFGADR